ncbi:MAG: hypothetical protein UU64_C0011G0025 [candidate division WWE3 bacterium GW2011_GWF2_41_45]|uniref:Uncharacterized protein n=2 Tax=Katanobacteria TaxID=422282 RepID=A0A1F4W413_UNCKA|nr:MAG: hypothetical protein UU55_C0012G0025 [candidate division WWE3 bacterium GW2011_GWC2_41_23]KKS10008.1 MAG: hypothetical protein UU64_C0011G0025 [candidate division WWE3 bacterium GW2011_GWF2_41_45]KKS11968.1 MAG: hypothetical protein UU68_C0007G0025 [candidate division WWE3 bacterium GW2011_GWF1_41_53]KKS19858.1 MAG: hypothetical protein UU79_C0008G0025 [candidate division WWE3 bacterium GW2011_GWE1_41_72]KKS28039.1 MAG: hypothetical protein UU86_C0014G0016 [candidate division WWE3 bacte
MRIHVLLKPGAKEPNIEQSNGIFRISVKAPAKENEANNELVDALSDYFGIAKNRISIVSGFNSRNKVVEIVPGAK